jgi:hypothetical protein
MVQNGGRSLLGQGGDEFAAELIDVWDNAAPDKVASTPNLRHPAG